eukprot:1265541-Rhodomonas_salina.2
MASIRTRMNPAGHCVRRITPPSPQPQVSAVAWHVDDEGKECKCRRDDEGKECKCRRDDDGKECIPSTPSCRSHVDPWMRGAKVPPTHAPPAGQSWHSSVLLRMYSSASHRRQSWSSCANCPLDVPSRLLLSSNPAGHGHADTCQLTTHTTMLVTAHTHPCQTSDVSVGFRRTGILMDTRACDKPLHAKCFVCLPLAVWILRFKLATLASASKRACETAAGRVVALEDVGPRWYHDPCASQTYPGLSAGCQPYTLQKDQNQSQRWITHDLLRSRGAYELLAVGAWLACNVDAGLKPSIRHHHRQRPRLLHSSPVDALNQGAPHRLAAPLPTHTACQRTIASPSSVLWFTILLSQHYLERAADAIGGADGGVRHSADAFRERACLAEQT